MVYLYSRVSVADVLWKDGSGATTRILVAGMAVAKYVLSRKSSFSQGLVDKRLLTPTSITTS